MSVVFARSTLTEHARRANTLAMTAVFYLESVGITSTCIASANGSNRTLQRGSARCVDKNLSGLNNITRLHLIRHESLQMLKTKERTKMYKFDLISGLHMGNRLRRWIVGVFGGC